MKRWYSPDGVRFSCQEGCAFCCRGEPGVVKVDGKERERIAVHLGIGEEELRRRYCRRRIPSSLIQKQGRKRQ